MWVYPFIFVKSHGATIAIALGEIERVRFSAAASFPPPSHDEPAQATVTFRRPQSATIDFEGKDAEDFWNAFTKAGWVRNTTPQDFGL